MSGVADTVEPGQEGEHRHDGFAVMMVALVVATAALLVVLPLGAAAHRSYQVDARVHLVGVTPTAGIPITLDNTTSPLPTTTEAGGGGGDDLPRTGTDIVRLLVPGLALIAAGVLALILGRRRTRAK